MIRFIPVLFLLLSALTFGATSGSAKEAAPKVRYKEGKELNFEELLIQGQLKRPDIQIVTGNEADDTNGLLRLRENFMDRMAVDYGETIP